MAHDILRPDGRNASVPHSKPVAANTSVINAPRGNRAVYGTVAKRLAQDRPKMGPTWPNMDPRAALQSGMVQDIPNMAST